MNDFLTVYVSYHAITEIITETIEYRTLSTWHVPDFVSQIDHWKREREV